MAIKKYNSIENASKIIQNTIKTAKTTVTEKITKKINLYKKTYKSYRTVKPTETPDEASETAKSSKKVETNSNTKTLITTKTSKNSKTSRSTKITTKTIKNTLKEIENINEETLEKEPCDSGEDCKNPVGIIDWVSCDACDKWYHCQCVNVQAKLASDENFVFICQKCQPGQITKCQKAVEKSEDLLLLKQEIQNCASGENNCVNPDEGIVDWVFCEPCQQWYHCQCENIDGEIAKEKDFVFVCKACEIQKQKVN